MCSSMCVVWRQQSESLPLRVSDLIIMRHETHTGKHTQLYCSRWQQMLVGPSEGIDVPNAVWKPFSASLGAPLGVFASVCAADSTVWWRAWVCVCLRVLPTQATTDEGACVRTLDLMSKHVCINERLKASEGWTGEAAFSGCNSWIGCLLLADLFY